MSDQVKYVLEESKLPEAWYNLASDLPEPPPPVLHPGTGQPVGPDDLAPLPDETVVPSSPDQSWRKTGPRIRTSVSGGHCASAVRPIICRMICTPATTASTSAARSGASGPRSAAVSVR